MEINTANERSEVYVLRYSLEKGDRSFKDIYGIYATAPRAKNALRQLTDKLLPTNLEIICQRANEVFLRHKKFDTVYHLFIDRKEVE